jgi:hypothetical protein
MGDSRIHQGLHRSLDRLLLHRAFVGIRAFYLRIEGRLRLCGTAGGRSQRKGCTAFNDFAALSVSRVAYLTMTELTITHSLSFGLFGVS